MRVVRRGLRCGFFCLVMAAECGFGVVMLLGALSGLAIGLFLHMLVTLFQPGARRLR